jgi:type II secretory pathway component PulM
MAALLGRFSLRERQLLLVAAAVLLLFLGWLLLWRPLAAARDTLRGQVAQSSADLAWMRQALPALAGSAATLPAPARDGRSLLARVDAGAR